LKRISGNYSTAGKRGHWPASNHILLPDLTLPYLSSPKMPTN